MDQVKFVKDYLTSFKKLKSKAIKKVDRIWYFLGIGSLFFYFYFGMVLDTHMKVGVIAPDFLEKMFLPPKLGKCAKTSQKIGFFEFIKEYGS